MTFMAQDLSRLRLDRKKKKGYFYILKAGKNNYKYGATTRDVAQRVRSARSITGLDYEVIYYKLCRDVFGFEKSYKWLMRDYHIADCEFFQAPSDIDDVALVVYAERLHDS